MKFKSLEITNFKSIDKLKYEPNHVLAVLTGKNGTGKSTFLEAVRYAITGELPDNPIRNEHDELTVDAVLQDAESTTFSRSSHIDKPAKIKVNGKATPAKNLADLLERSTGVSAKAMKITSSSEVIEKLKPAEFGEFILSYIPEELTLDIVYSYIDDLTPEAEMELSMMLPEAPTKFGTKEIREVYNHYFEERKFTKREIENRKARIAAYVGESPTRTVKEIDHELEIINKQEGETKAIKNALALYQKTFDMKVKQENLITNLEKQIAEITATRPNPTVLNDITTKKKQYMDNIIAAEKVMQTLTNNLEDFTVYLKEINEPICPLAKSLDEDMQCHQDRTCLKTKIEETIQSCKDGILLQKKQVDEWNELVKELGTKEGEYRNNASLYEKKIVLSTQLETAKKNVPVLPKKPEMTEVKDYSETKDALKAERDRITLYERCEKEKEEMANLTTKLGVHEFLVKALSPKGCVMEKITKHYLDVFEDVCNDRAAKLKKDFTLKFIYDDGVTIMCEPHAGFNFLPYESLSSGEKALVLFLLMDMLNTLSGLKILMMDDLDKLDVDAFKNLMTLLADSSIQADYDHIFICAVNHKDTEETLKSLKDFDWIVK